MNVYCFWRAKKFALRPPPRSPRHGDSLDDDVEEVRKNEGQTNCEIKVTLDRQKWNLMERRICFCIKTTELKGERKK